MSVLRIVLADDHALVRAGFVALLRRCADFEVVGEAANGRAGLRLIEELDPHVALVDISMPELNGLEMTARATKEHPSTRVIVLSMHADEEYVRQALVSGPSVWASSGRTCKGGLPGRLLGCFFGETQGRPDSARPCAL